MTGGKIDLEREGVDEEADGVFRSRHRGVAAGAGGSEDNTVFPAVTAKQERESRLDEGVQRETMGGGEGAEIGCQGSGEVEIGFCLGGVGGNRISSACGTGTVIGDGPDEVIDDQRGGAGDAAEVGLPEGEGGRVVEGGLPEIVGWEGGERGQGLL